MHRVMNFFCPHIRRKINDGHRRLISSNGFASDMNMWMRSLYRNRIGRGRVRIDRDFISPCRRVGMDQNLYRLGRQRRKLTGTHHRSHSPISCMAPSAIRGRHRGTPPSHGGVATATGQQVGRAATATDTVTSLRGRDTAAASAPSDACAVVRVCSLVRIQSRLA
jgi:hypothetical protein